MESTTTDVAANTSTTTDEVKVSITTDVNLDVDVAADSSTPPVEALNTSIEAT